MDQKSDVLKILKEKLEELGTTNQSVYDKNRGDSLYSTAIMRRVNMTWRELIKEIGMHPQRTLLPPEILLKNLKVEFERIGSYNKSAYIEKRNKKKFPNPRILTNHLGMNWLEITRACGREDVPKFKKDQVTDEELIDEYKRLSKRNGQPLTVRELQSETAFSYDIYRQHFGTMGQIRKSCGFQEKTKKTIPIVSKRECEIELMNIYNKYGRVSYSDLQKLSTISLSTIFRRFKTSKINVIWDEILYEER